MFYWGFIIPKILGCNFTAKHNPIGTSCYFLVAVGYPKNYLTIPKKPSLPTNKRKMKQKTSKKQRETKKKKLPREKACFRPNIRAAI